METLLLCLNATDFSITVRQSIIKQVLLACGLEHCIACGWPVEVFDADPTELTQLAIDYNRLDLLDMNQVKLKSFSLDKALMLGYKDIALRVYRNSQCKPNVSDEALLHEDSIEVMWGAGKNFSVLAELALKWRKMKCFESLLKQFMINTEQTGDLNEIRYFTEYMMQQNILDIAVREGHWRIVDLLMGWTRVDQFAKTFVSTNPTEERNIHQFQNRY